MNRCIILSQRAHYAQSWRAVWLDVGDPVVAPLQTLIWRRITEQGKQENRKDQAQNLLSYSKDLLPLFYIYKRTL